MSESVIKVMVICFTIICCFGMMCRAMIEQSKYMSENKQEEEPQGGAENG